MQHHAENKCPIVLQTTMNASNNKHSSCPARMSDGRLFTNYSSRCAMEAAVFTTPRSSDMDSYDTRQFLIHNAENIIRAQRQAAITSAQCGPCVNTMLPEKIIDTCDTHKCSRSPGSADGIGLGRNYGAAIPNGSPITQVDGQNTYTALLRGAPIDYRN